MQIPIINAELIPFIIYFRIDAEKFSASDNEEKDKARKFQCRDIIEPENFRAVK